MKKLLALLAFCLSGCASHLNQEQCLSMNWYQIGMQDGAAGQAPRNLAVAIEDCQKFNIAVNQQGYMQGWRKGLHQYCTPDFNLGLEDDKAGTAMSNISSHEAICASANIRLSLDNYKRGRHLGLKSFCTYENGASLARKGYALSDVCEGP